MHILKKLYNPLANIDDGSCILIGCTDSSYVEYYTQGFIPTTGDEFDLIFCNTLVTLGCTNDLYLEYSSGANTDDGSCITEVVYGCAYSWADNYNSSANTDDGSCYREGCTSESAYNYDALATIDNGSCQPIDCLYECCCNHFGVFNESCQSTCATIYCDDDFCPEDNIGCTADWADNYDSLATIDDGHDRLGCTEWADNYDDMATTDDGSCILTVFRCKCR